MKIKFYRFRGVLVISVKVPYWIKLKGAWRVVCGPLHTIYHFIPRFHWFSNRQVLELTEVIKLAHDIKTGRIRVLR